VKFIFIILLTSTFSLIPKKNKNWIKGKWSVDCLIKNGDTIFKRDNYNYTLQYNKILNSKLNTDVDTIAIETMAKVSFQNTCKLFWEFRDGTFQTAAMRSGGRGNLEDTDNGTFFCSNDSIYMTNNSRNHYKSIFLKNEKDKFLYFEDKSSSNVYTKLKKIN
jgi:hypothetical protein